MHRFAILIVLGLVVGACGGGDAADPERFCEIIDELGELDDFLSASPDDARRIVGDARGLLDEAQSVVPDEIETSFESEANVVTTLLDFFEEAGFDGTQMDENALDAAMTAVDDPAASEAVTNWIDTNCAG